MLVQEVLSRNLRDRRAVARYAGLTGSPDESGTKRRERGLAKAGNARVRRGLIQLKCRKVWRCGRPIEKDLKARDTVRSLSLSRLCGDRRSTTVRGGGKPNPAMAVMPLREWPRRLGACHRSGRLLHSCDPNGSNRIQAWLVQPRHGQGGLPSDQQSRQPPHRDRMPPCSPPSRCGLGIAQYKLMSARRPTLTVPARGRPRNPWPGRKNACGAAEPKNGKKMER